MKQLFGIVGTNLTIQVTTILQSILLARILGPELRGLFSSIIILPNIVAPLGILGVNIALTRLIAKYNHNIVIKDSIKRSTLYLSAVTSAMFSLGLLTYYFLFFQPTSQYFELYILFVLFIPANHFTINFLAIDLGNQDYKLYNRARLILNPLYLTIIIILYILDIDSLIFFLLALIFANYIVAITKIYENFKLTSISGKLFSNIKILKKGLPFSVSNSLEPIIQWVDKGMVILLFSPEVIGYYLIGSSSATLANFLTNSTATYSFSKSSSNENKNFITLVKISFVFWFFVIILFQFILDFLVLTVFGNDYFNSIIIGKIMVFSAGFLGLTNLFDQTLKGMGYAYDGAYSRILGLIILVAFSISTKPDIEMFCLFMIVSSFVSFIAIILFYKKRDSRFIFSDLILRTSDLKYLLKNFSK